MLWRAYTVQSAKLLILEFSLGLDLRVLEWSPVLAFLLSEESACPSLPLPLPPLVCACALFLILLLSLSPIKK